MKSVVTTLLAILATLTLLQITGTMTVVNLFSPNSKIDQQGQRASSPSSEPGISVVTAGSTPAASTAELEARIKQLEAEKKAAQLESELNALKAKTNPPVATTGGSQIERQSPPRTKSGGTRLGPQSCCPQPPAYNPQQDRRSPHAGNSALNALQGNRQTVPPLSSAQRVGNPSNSAVVSEYSIPKPSPRLNTSVAQDHDVDFRKKKGKNIFKRTGGAIWGGMKKVGGGFKKVGGGIKKAGKALF